MFHPYAVLRTLGIPARTITTENCVRNKLDWDGKTEFKDAYAKEADDICNHYYDENGTLIQRDSDKKWLVNAP